VSSERPRPSRSLHTAQTPPQTGVAAVILLSGAPVLAKSASHQHLYLQLAATGAAAAAAAQAGGPGPYRIPGHLPLPAAADASLEC